MIHFNGTDLYPQQSVSKLWVALAALDMADRGMLDLGENGTVRVPDLAVFHSPIRRSVVANGSFSTSYRDFLSRALTESDNTWFTLLTMNQHPLHFDTEYASKSEFGKPLVNSCLTLSIVAGMSVSDISQKTIANLGWDKIKLTAPVYVGDTLYAESVVLSKRESKSRPTQGIVSVRTMGFNQDGKEVISYERTMLIPKKGHAVDDVADY